MFYINNTRIPKLFSETVLSYGKNVWRIYPSAARRVKLGDGYIGRKIGKQTPTINYYIGSLLGYTMWTNTEQQNRTTNSAKLKLYFTATLFLPCRNLVKFIIYPNIEDAHTIHVETQKYFNKTIYISVYVCKTKKNGYIRASFYIVQTLQVQFSNTNFKLCMIQGFINGLIRLYL